MVDNGNTGARGGAPPPSSGSAPVARQREQGAGDQEKQQAHYPTLDTGPATVQVNCDRVVPRDRRIVELRQRAVAAGWRVDVVAGRRIDCWRWSRVRSFDTVDEAEQFIASVEVRRG